VYRARVFDIVVAADLDWGIGKNNALPWPKLKGDLQHFRRITSEGGSNAVVMGRKSWEAAEVAGKPLPNRRNIVITRGELAVPAGVVVVHSLDEGLAAARDAAATFVIGGAQIVAIALDHAELRWVYLTRIAARFDCDARLPDLDARFVHDAWDGERTLEDSGVRYRIERLRKR
jgi:dihydrofolate reductase